MSEQRRLWCSLHHSFWRDCSACVEADYINLARQLVEVEEKRDDWKATAELCQNEDAKSTIIESQQERLAEAQEKNRQLREKINRWVQAYSPDIIVYPSTEAVRAVNRTPEFIVGRNATMQAVHEGLLDILSKEGE